jgi:hemoglobin
MFTSRRPTAWAFVGLFLAAALAAPARAADENPAGDIRRGDLDRQIDAALRQVISDACQLHNAGKFSESAHTFRGGLIAVKPLLRHHPRAQKLIEKGLADSQRQWFTEEQSWELRYVVDAVREEVWPQRPPTGKGDTLWQRVGGERNATRIVDDFIDAAIRDPAVNFFRGDKFKMTPEQIQTMKRHIVLLASDITGGPDRYTGKSMAKAHENLGITDAEFNAILPHLERALRRHDVKPKDIAIIMEAAASTRKSIVRAPIPPNEETIPAKTMWDRLGGEKGVTRIVSDLVDAAVADPQVNFSRNGKFPMTPERVAAVKKHLVRLASGLGEGPFKYDGRRMGPLHRGMGITDDEFNAFVSKMRIALERHKVAAEDRDLILKAVNATRKDIVEVKDGKTTTTVPVPPPTEPTPLPGARAGAGGTRPPADSVGEWVVIGTLILVFWFARGCPLG